jgi:hypothetical protein
MSTSIKPRPASLPEARLAAWWLRSPAGGLVARPWLDALSLRVLSRWFFPLSRMWAAAGVADGDAERFFAAISATPDRAALQRATRALARFETARQRSAEADARWEDAFFSPATPSDSELIAIETERRNRKHAFNATRRHFRSLLRPGLAIPPVRWAIPTPEDAAADFAAALADIDAYYAPPAPLPKITRSRRVQGPAGPEYWLRFASPSTRLNDTVHARVFEPEGVANPPTLVFGHGICVESDHWRGLVDEVHTICRAGIRVIRPEAPGHGRRVAPGRYGGESFIAQGPAGPLETFGAELPEWAVLVGWARDQGSRAVAVGGTSLGALATQLLITHAQNWPEHLRPDAALLITHCGAMADTATRSSLATAWGVGEAMAAAGWGPADGARFFALVDPAGLPVMPPENIVTVLGDRDTVTPYDSGRTLIESWGLPAENRFIWPRGHFSVPAGLVHDSAPIRRFAAILKSLN